MNLPPTITIQSTAITDNFGDTRTFFDTIVNSMASITAAQLVNLTSGTTTFQAPLNAAGVIINPFPTSNTITLVGNSSDVGVPISNSQLSILTFYTNPGVFSLRVTASLPSLALIYF